MLVIKPHQAFFNVSPIFQHSTLSDTKITRKRFLTAQNIENNILKH